MKNILFLAFILCAANVFGQVIRVSPTELAFLQSTSIVNFKIDLSKTKMGSFNSIDEWVDFRYQEIKLDAGVEDADDWKKDWGVGLAAAMEEFRIDFNAHMEGSNVRLKEGATTVEYTAILHVEDLRVPEGIGNKPVEMKAQLIFYKGGKQVSVVDISELKGFPTGGISMRVKSAFRRAGGHTAEKIFLIYFK